MCGWLLRDGWEKVPALKGLSTLCRVRPLGYTPWARPGPWQWSKGCSPRPSHWCRWLIEVSTTLPPCPFSNPSKGQDIQCFVLSSDTATEP